MSDDGFDEERMSVLEYARHHGLTRPYPLSVFDDLQHFTVPDDDSRADDECLVQAAALLEELEAKTLDERLQVDRGVAAALVSLLDSEIETHLHECSAVTNARRARPYLELPILSTCNHLDMAQFAPRVRPDLTDTSNLPHWDDEITERSLWPPQSSEVASKIEQQIAVEKLSASREIMTYMSTALRAEDEVPLETRIDFASRPKQRIQCLTPPFLPLSLLLPHKEIDIPSSPFRKPPVPSQISETLSEEIRRIDEAATCHDTVQNLCSDSETDETEMLLQEVIHQPQELSDSPQRPLRLSNHEKAKELKMELPLTPEISPAKPTKTVSFPETLKEYIPEGPSFPSSDEVESSPNTSALKVISPLAAEASKLLDHETLIEADSTKRMDVPKVDFTLPPLLWEVRSLHGLTHRCHQTIPDHIVEFKCHRGWPMTAHMERKMLWNPLPSGLINFELSEDIDCAPAQVKILIADESESIIDSDSLAQKGSGVRLLETIELEYETELLSIFEDDCHEVVSNVSKNHDERQGRQARSNPDPQPISRSCGILDQFKQVTPSESAHFISKRKHSFQEGPNAPLFKSRKINEDLVPGAFFGASSLNHFLELQNAQQHIDKRKVQMSNNTSPPKDQLDNDHDGSRISIIQSKSLPRITSSSTPVQLPRLRHDAPSCCVVVNSDFYSQRYKTLRLEVQRSYPTAQFVERDYSRTAIGGDLRRHGNTVEADMAVSAKTGLLWTTLQMAKQTPLPAQTDFFGIKERLLHVSRRYEHLVVLLSEGRDEQGCQHSTGQADLRCANPNIDGRDCWVFEELVAHASTLESSVHVVYVPGGEKELGRWIAGVMRRYGECGNTSPTIPLLHEETQWEIILRHLGLNAVAAQVVLATLKKDQASTGVSDQKQSKLGIQSPITDDMYGLSAFVCMSPAERIQQFRGSPGDGRLMEMINRVLDQQWMSASRRLSLTSEGDLHHPSRCI